MSLSTEKVINLIKDYSSHSENTVVDFSGGKYSLVLLHLALKALRDVKAVYVDTTISLPECNEYVKEICDEWGVDLFIIRREDIDFWGLVERRGFPTPRFTWCRRELKYIPLKIFNKSIGGNCLHLTGTTMAESDNRRRVYSIRGKYYINYTLGSFTLQPLLTWNQKMVDKYIEKNSFMMDPSYAFYGRGGNCYYCPHNKRREYYLKLSEKHPKLFEKIVKAEKGLRSRGAAIYLGRGKLLYIHRLLALRTTE